MDCLFLFWGQQQLSFFHPPLLYWGFPDSSAGQESACNAGDPGSISGSGSSPGEGIGYPLQYSWASLVAQLVKNPPAVQETWVRSLDWEDSPGEGKDYPLQYSSLENSINWDWGLSFGSRHVSQFGDAYICFLLHSWLLLNCGVGEES